MSIKIIFFQFIKIIYYFTVIKNWKRKKYFVIEINRQSFKRKQKFAIIIRRIIIQKKCLNK